MFVGQQVRQQIFLFLHQYGLIILPFGSGFFVASGTNPAYSRVIVGDGVGGKRPSLSYFLVEMDGGGSGWMAMGFLGGVSVSGSALADKRDGRTCRRT